MIRRMPRGWGIVVCCDGGGCDARVATANLLYRVNRAYAESLGWGRGSVPRTAVSLTTKKHDLWEEIGKMKNRGDRPGVTRRRAVGRPWGTCRACRW